ncbi:MAG: GDP-mannose 4,6-dehydratase [Candidatus Lokiarchaeota archaeon]|nr:GDP-mannose 4,6-dehydratase [Candidatus Lokiarchaeota archaeon]
MARSPVVTGGAGFIGTHLVRALVARGMEVAVIDNLSSGSIDGIKDLIDGRKVTFHEIDIRDKAALYGVISGKEGMIYHLAADPRVKESVGQPVESFDQNVVGTLNLLEVMREKRVPCMVFASSGGTLYGDTDVFPTSEVVPLKPISPYGASKAAAESYMSAYAGSYGLKIASLRFANIYGPGTNHGVMYDFFHKLRRDPSRLEILGDGRQAKSYLYISDCVDACTLVGDWLEKQAGGTFEAYNLGTRTCEAVTDLARLMVDILGLKDVKFEYTGGSRGWTGDVVKTMLDVSKIERLGWKPRVGFKEGVERYLASLKAT